jgi:C-terminal processing protease CtpA/Prc
MRVPQRLIVIAAALALTSCTAYVHHSPHERRAYDGERPCPHDGRGGVIGLSIGRPDATTGPIIVERVAPGGPAGEANIQPGDRIRAIDGESTRSMTVSEAARLIRGRTGTAVELRIESPRGARLITLVRVPYVHWRERRHGDRRPCRHHKDHPPCDHGARGYETPPPAAPPGADDD